MAMNSFAPEEVYPVELRGYFFLTQSLPSADSLPSLLCAFASLRELLFFSQKRRDAKK